jgi:hypothetical protein
MDIDSLRCFEAAATTLNFRAAAGRVHLSPAAFSDRLQRLERLGRVFRRASWSERAALAWGLFLLPLFAGAGNLGRRLRESRLIAKFATIAALVGAWWVWTILKNI